MTTPTPTKRRVDLTYFRTTGKFYSEGSYETTVQHLWQIWEEVDRMRRERRLPGLQEGHSNYIVLVDVPDHEHNHPVLIGIPGSMEA